MVLAVLEVEVHAVKRRGGGPMKRKNASELSITLMQKTEAEGLDGDLALWEVAAMVYVGDIYALVALGVDDESNNTAPASAPNSSVWPFIR